MANTRMKHFSVGTLGIFAVDEDLPDDGLWVEAGVARDLLDALKEIASEWEQCNRGKGPNLPWGVRTLEIARAAIAKAEGREG